MKTKLGKSSKMNETIYFKRARAAESLSELPTKQLEELIVRFVEANKDFGKFAGHPWSAPEWDSATVAELPVTHPFYQSLAAMDVLMKRSLRKTGEVNSMWR